MIEINSHFEIQVLARLDLNLESQSQGWSQIENIQI